MMIHDAKRGGYKRTEEQNLGQGWCTESANRQDTMVWRFSSLEYLLEMSSLIQLAEYENQE